MSCSTRPLTDSDHRRLDRRRPPMGPVAGVVVSGAGVLIAAAVLRRID
jgi:hypothetical protein